MHTLLDQPSPDFPPLPPLHVDWEDDGNTAFRAALDSILSGEFAPGLHYQPIVDLRRGVIAGYEALARFPAAMGPSPDICFAAADLVGKRLELEQVVALTALHSRSLLPPDCFLSINVSPSFLISPQWQIVLSSVSDLARIIVEITEEEAIGDYEPFRCRIAQIRSMGGSIAVDDAGSGYASLQHVLEIKPSFIKLDRSFIKNCYADRAKSALIEMMGRAANRLDAWIVAEGMETEQELAELIHLGVPLGQGYYLGRPHPVMQTLAPEKAEWIRSHIHEQGDAEKISHHVETCAMRSTHKEAHDLLASTSLDMVMVTDEWNRPIKMLERHALLGPRDLLDIMRIQISSNPSEALQRALTRPAATRFDPLAVIDTQGVLQGIVYIDRLMCAVLNANVA